MNVRDELSFWRYREVTVDLHVYECLSICESIKQFFDETSEKSNNFFTEIFCSQIDKQDLSLAFNFFNQIKANNSDIQELLSFHEEVDKRAQTSNAEVAQSAIESTDPLGFDLWNRISDINLKEVSISIALLPLIAALRVSEAYESEVKIRKNEESSLNQSNDWIPPSTFVNGTDDEREIWNDFQRSQNLRK